MQPQIRVLYDKLHVFELKKLTVGHIGLLYPHNRHGLLTWSEHMDLLLAPPFSGMDNAIGLFKTALQEELGHEVSVVDAPIFSIYSSILVDYKYLTATIYESIPQEGINRIQSTLAIRLFDVLVSK